MKNSNYVIISTALLIASCISTETVIYGDRVFRPQPTTVPVEVLEIENGDVFFEQAFSADSRIAELDQPIRFDVSHHRNTVVIDFNEATTLTEISPSPDVGTAYCSVEHTYSTYRSNGRLLASVRGCLVDQDRDGRFDQHSSFIAMGSGAANDVGGIFGGLHPLPNQVSYTVSHEEISRFGNMGLKYDDGEIRVVLLDENFNIDTEFSSSLIKAAPTKQEIETDKSVKVGESGEYPKSFVLFGAEFDVLSVDGKKIKVKLISPFPEQSNLNMNMMRRSR